MREKYKMMKDFFEIIVLRKEIVPVERPQLITEGKAPVQAPIPHDCTPLRIPSPRGIKDSAIYQAWASEWASEWEWASPSLFSSTVFPVWATKWARGSA